MRLFLIQSIFLARLSKTNTPFVFKGGISLSKAFSIINRFSEDIDLSVSRKLTLKEKRDAKDHIISIARELGLTI